jgi:hypothetical protein
MELTFGECTIALIAFLTGLFMPYIKYFTYDLLRAIIRGIVYFMWYVLKCPMKEGRRRRELLINPKIIVLFLHTIHDHLKWEWLEGGTIGMPRWKNKVNS